MDIEARIKKTKLKNLNREILTIEIKIETLKARKKKYMAEIEQITAEDLTMPKFEVYE